MEHDQVLERDRVGWNGIVHVIEAGNIVSDRWGRGAQYSEEASHIGRLIGIERRRRVCIWRRRCRVWRRRREMLFAKLNELVYDESAHDQNEPSDDNDGVAIHDFLRSRFRGRRF